MAKRSFLKVFFDFEKKTETLSDAEKARLLLAMLRYAESGKVPDLSGNERHLFPVFKVAIDSDAADYDAFCEKQRANGSKGGRPAKNPENPVVISNNPNNPVVSEDNPKNPTVFQETQKSQKVDSRYKKVDHPPIIPPLATEEDMKTQADHDEILDKMRYVGFSMSVAEMDKVIALYADYGKDAVLTALDECVGATNKMRYLEAVLKKGGKQKDDNWEDEVWANSVW